MYLYYFYVYMYLCTKTLLSSVYVYVHTVHTHLLNGSGTPQRGAGLVLEHELAVLANAGDADLVEAGRTVPRALKARWITSKLTLHVHSYMHLYM